jgi:hypothetical protein
MSRAQPRSLCSVGVADLCPNLLRRLPAACHEEWLTEDGPHPAVELGAVADKRGASSFSPAVPPACHKQRSSAVSSGHSRSLAEER